ncbi:MAG: SH3 domain-containing protein, partial [Caldilinea sp.]
MQRLSCPPIPVCRTVFVCALLWLLLASHIPASAQVENTERGQVAVARLNLRTTPALSAPIAGRLTQGTAVQILGRSEDGRWYQVTTADGLDGWLYAVYVKIDDKGELAAERSSAAPVSAAESAQGATTAVTTPARMNVRGGPGTNYPVVASAPAGSVYVVVGINPARDWYQVSVPGRQEPAWIFARLSTLNGSVESVPVAENIPAPPAVVQTATAPPA